MRIFGVKRVPSVYGDVSHPNHWAFAHKVGVTSKDILASTFQSSSASNPIHAADETLSNVKKGQLMSKMGPTVYYLSVDHEGDAIILTLRGTMGLSDALTDFTCEYFDYKGYKMHKGMYECAMKLSTHILPLVQHALSEFDGYSFVITGHSLGAGIAAILSIVWSDVLESKGQVHYTMIGVKRPIRCFGYGMPCIGDQALGTKCEHLITSVVHGNDLVPTLSLGLVQDIRHMMTYLTELDNNKGCERIISHALGLELSEQVDHEWLRNAYKNCKQSMIAEKLYPPGKVFWIRSRQINKRVPKSLPNMTVELPDEPKSYLSEAANSASRMVSSTVMSFTNWAAHSFYPSAASTSTIATFDKGSAYFHEEEQVLVSLDLVEDVHQVFGHLTFSTTMLSDHLPMAYETAINHLVVDLLQ